MGGRSRFAGSWCDGVELLARDLPWALWCDGPTAHGGRVRWMRLHAEGKASASALHRPSTSPGARATSPQKNAQANVSSCCQTTSRHHLTACRQTESGRFRPRPFKFSHHALDARPEINYQDVRRLACIARPSQPSQAVQSICPFPAQGRSSGLNACGHTSVFFSTRC